MTARLLVAVELEAHTGGHWVLFWCSDASPGCVTASWCHRLRSGGASGARWRTPDHFPHHKKKVDVLQNPVDSGALDAIHSAADAKTGNAILRPTVWMGAPISQVVHFQGEITAAAGTMGVGRKSLAKLARLLAQLTCG
jgi:hypothetical protein